MSNWDYILNQPQQGWECPRCHRINAPWLPNCSCESEMISGYISTKTNPSKESYRTTCLTYTDPCPKCGGSLRLIVKTSIPPIYIRKCVSCGYEEEQ